MTLPVGALGNTLLVAADMLARSATFQTKVGAANAAIAAKSIFRPFRRDHIAGLNFRASFAVVGREGEPAIQYDPGSRGDKPVGGTITFQLFCPSESFEHGESDLLFANYCDGVTQDLIAIQDVDTYLTFSEVRGLGLYEIPFEEQPSRGNYWHHAIEVEWVC